MSRSPVPQPPSPRESRGRAPGLSRFWIAGVGAVLAFGLGAAAAEGLKIPDAPPGDVAELQVAAETPFQTVARANAEANPYVPPMARDTSAVQGGDVAVAAPPSAFEEEGPPADVSYAAEDLSDAAAAAPGSRQAGGSQASGDPQEDEAPPAAGAPT